MKEQSDIEMNTARIKGEREKKKPNLGAFDTWLTESQTRDLVLTNLKNFEDTMSIMSALFKRLDVLDDKYFLSLVAKYSMSVIRDFTNDAVTYMRR